MNVFDSFNLQTFNTIYAYYIGTYTAVYIHDMI